MKFILLATVLCAAALSPVAAEPASETRALLGRRLFGSSGFKGIFAPIQKMRKDIAVVVKKMPPLVPKETYKPATLQTYKPGWKPLKPWTSNDDKRCVDMQDEFGKVFKEMDQSTETRGVRGVRVCVRGVRVCVRGVRGVCVCACAARSRI